MQLNTGQTTLRKGFAAVRIGTMKGAGLAGIAATLFFGGISPAMSTVMKFDFFFNGKNESGSGMLEAIENKDGSFTAISGFVRTLDNDAAKPLQAFENIYGKMSPEDIANLEKISLDETKGSEYLPLFVNPKGSEVSYSPSGYFFYDNVLYPSSTDLLLGNPGLLFTAASGKELNLFTNGPSSYVDYWNNGFNIPTSFHLIALSDYSPSTPLAELPDSPMITAIPEPSSLALLGLGFLNFFLFRRMSTKGNAKSFNFSGILARSNRVSMFPFPGG